MRAPDSFSAITAGFPSIQKSVAAHKPSTERQVTFRFTVQSRFLDPQHGPCFASILFRLEFGGGFQKFRIYLYPVVLVQNCMTLNSRSVRYIS